jgi:hypothetical protein
MYKPYTNLLITYFTTYLPIYETYFPTELVTKVNPNINSVKVHPQLSYNWHPVDGVLVGAGSLWSLSLCYRGEVKRGLLRQGKARQHDIKLVGGSIPPLPSHNRLPMDGVQVAGAIALLANHEQPRYRDPQNKNSINTSLVCKHHI